ncbi:MAG TPA: anti-sigma factor [Streptosporangiaceae bacterium]|nr:anti-sigma factor [Streptosporangiaceae bacterium]
MDDRERNRFERHLNRCQACAREVRGFLETATQLAMAVARPTPSQLRERVLAAATRTPQLPAVAGRQSPVAARSAWPVRIAAGVAAVGVAAAIVLGVTQINARHELDRAQAQNRAVAAVLAAPDARVRTAPTTAGGTATVVVSPARHEMIFTTAGLAPLPTAKVYQLWLIGPSRIRSAGLLPAPQAGVTAPVLSAALGPGDKVGVTVEPAGGTAQPTTTPILLIPLSA